MKPRVLIAPAPLKEIESVYGPTLTAAGFEMVFPEKNHQMTEVELLAQLPGCVGSLAGSEPYTAEVIEAAVAKGLRVIARAGVGYDGVDLDAATKHGVVVAFAPGTNQDAVAEHTFMLILALAKNLIVQNALTKKGEWPRKANLPIRGTTIGLAGLGRIGKAMVLLAKAFNMKILAYEPYPDLKFVEEHKVALVSLDDLMKQSDWVSLHMPMLPESKKCINRRTLELMKPSAFLINTARGGVVDEADLYEVLKNKRIAGAALDVFDEEPPVGNPLLTLDNVLVTAHTAGVDRFSRSEMARVAGEALAKLLTGGWPAEWIVNPEVKAAFQAR